MQISSSIFEKVFSRIPDRSEINLIDEQENDHVQIESLDVISIFRIIFQYLCLFICC